MMTDSIKVTLLGLGEIGKRLGTFIHKKNGLEIVAAVDVAPDLLDKDLGDILNLGEKTHVKVSNNLEKTLNETKTDIVVNATSSFVKQVYDSIMTAVNAGCSVVSTCEELTYPFLTENDLSKKLDEAAKNNGVTILGSGINPGFLMDALPVMLTAVCQEVNKIKIVRQMNASTRRLPFQKKIGAGLTVDEFTEKINSGSITGHVGLEQSIAFIAYSLNWKFDKIEIGEVKPMIAEKEVNSDFIKVNKGDVTGLEQSAYGIINNEKIVTLEFFAYLGADEEFDAINIDGTPPINQKISPCVHGDLSTVAVIVNSIPNVINGKPGLTTMKDLALPSAL